MIYIQWLVPLILLILAIYLGKKQSSEPLLDMLKGFMVFCGIGLFFIGPPLGLAWFTHTGFAGFMLCFFLKISVHLFLSIGLS